MGQRFAASEMCARLRRLSVSTSATESPFPWAQVFARAPLEELKVSAGSGTDAPELLAALSSAPPTGKLRCLRIFGINTTGANVAGWLKSGYAAAVRELELEYTRLEDLDLQALAELPELARLTRLTIRGYSSCTPDGLYRLLASPHLINLRHLEVSTESLSADVMRDFARHAACRGLRVLSAATLTNMGDDTEQAPEPSALSGILAGLPFPHLHTLKTRPTADDRTPDELRGLLDSPNLPNLCALRVGFRDTRHAAWERFASGSRLAWIGGHTNGSRTGCVALHPRNVFLPNHLDEFGF